MSIEVNTYVVGEGDIPVNTITIEEQIEVPVRVGVDGVTFTPVITEVSNTETILSFVNNGYEDNPPSTNIKGGQGIQGMPGNPGVAISSTEPIDHLISVWIDPDGDPDILPQDISNWNLAFSWGNHNGLYTLIAHTGATGNAHGVVTHSVNGFMSSSDKTILDSIQGMAHSPVTLETTNGLSIVGQALSLGLATSSTTGALSGADWITFNGKQDLLNYTPENVANKVNTLSAFSTNIEYPGAKLVFDQLALKVDSIPNMGLSSNDFTDALRNKLFGIDAGAEVNNISDANAIELVSGNSTTLHIHTLADLLDDSSHRLVTDAQKVIWTAKQDALGFIPENIANKTSVLNSLSTSDEYPNAETVFNALSLKQTRFAGICATTPIGAEDISIDYLTRVLTITPPLGYFRFFVDGDGYVTKFEKTGPITFPAFTDISGIWYFYFDVDGEPVVTQTPWVDFDTVVVIYRILWNSSLLGSAKSVVENIETHVNTVSAIDHAWKHKYGTIWYSGFDSIHNAIIAGTPNVDGRNTVISLTTGSNIDDNLLYTIRNGIDIEQWKQDMGVVTAGTLTSLNSGLFKVRYSDVGGLVYSLPSTRFPFPWDSVTNRPQYITTSGVRTLVTNGYFFVTYVYSIQDPRNGEAVKIVTAPTEFSSITNARASNWIDVQTAYLTLNDGEIRPLYKLIFEARNAAPQAFDVACKYSCLREVSDIRKTQVTSLATSAGSLPASSVTYVPTGSVSSTNVQNAISELDIEKENITNKVTSLSVASTDTQYPTAKLAYDQLLLKEDKTNKKSTITNSETDYPNGKAVYDANLLNEKIADVPVYNVTVQVPLSAGQYYTPTTARAAVPVGVRKLGLKITFATGAMVWEEEQFIGTATTGWAVATNWLNKFAMLSENWVGVVIDPANSCSEPAPKSTVTAYKATELQRTGNLNYHKFGKSRIFNAIYPAIVVRSTKKVAWRLDKSDFTKKDDGTASVPDWTIHNICIIIPKLYRRVVLLDGVDTGRYEIRWDIAPFDGAEVFCNVTAHSIGFAAMDRTATQLVSVISDDVRFRGGGNSAANDAHAWNWDSLLGKPATDISRTNFENYAAAAGWETGNIWTRTLWQELLWLYFANTNNQLPFDSVLTAEGYPQGGLGAGNTNYVAFRWTSKNSYYPINKIGTGSLAIGCKVGVKAMTDDKYYIGKATSVSANNLVATSHFSAANGWLAAYVGYTVQNMTTLAEATIVAKTDDNTLQLSADIFTAANQWFWIKGVNFAYEIPVFFGLEHLYGEIYDWVSGINILKHADNAGALSRAYVCRDFTKRAVTITADYTLVGLVPRADGYIKTLFPGLNIVRANTGSSSATYIADYGYFSNLPANGESVYGCLFGGDANNGGLAYAGGTAGSGCVITSYAPSNTTAYIGSRLRAEIID